MVGFLAALLLVAPQDGLEARLRTDRWRAVEELGATPDARPRLEALAAGKDAEVAWWAGAALAELDARERGGDAYAAPLRMTLDVQGRPADVVLRELLEKAGLRLTETVAKPPAITVSRRDAPLVEALDDVAGKCGLVVARLSGKHFRLMPAGEPPVGCTYSGSFRVAITSLARVTEADFVQEPRSRLEVELDVRADPRLRVLDGETRLEWIAAEDDTGRSLLPAARSCVADGPSAIACRLEAPAKEARRLAVLRGALTVSLARTTEEFVFERVLTAGRQEKERGGVTCALEECAAAKEDRYAVQLSLSVRSDFYYADYGEFLLEDADGRGLTSNVRGVVQGRKSQSGRYAIGFARPAGVEVPARMRVCVVTGKYDRRVFFEFRDLILK